MPLLVETGVSKWIHPDTPNGRVVLLDEIDGMTNMDKGGIEALIKLIRPKKTAKIPKL